MCAAKISVLAIYMLSYMEILTCFVWCLLILFYYVIKMEIKQLKRFFFCLYFNPVLSRNSFTTSVLQMYIVGNLVQQNSTCILYFGYVTFWLCRTSDNSKYFLHSLGLWDNEVDLYVNCMKHDPIDLIYNFTLSKALLIYIYIVSIWFMTSFTIHLASNMCLYTACSPIR